MTDPPQTDPFVQAVQKKAERMAKARRERVSVWEVLAHAGTLGWQLVLPLVGFTLAGHALGRLLDHDGPTLAGLLLGLALGLWQAGRNLLSGAEP